MIDAGRNASVEARRLVQNLARSLDATLLETHISWILLAGDRAYKLKKPVRLPFVDYSTPERRLHFCQEEVRLNQRLAPGVYLGVARICGPSDAPVIDGAGPVLDHAVRMKRFPPGSLFSERLATGTLQAASVDRFAALLADFHAGSPRGAGEGADDRLLLRRALAALDGARPLLAPPDAAAIARWLASEWAAVAASWRARLAGGKVREGHGDLHLANVVALDGEVAAFDCIEFDPALRTLDVLDDAAFALMDFVARGRADLGWRFINAWLEHTGEYDGVGLLRFYVVSHALVRAQVEHLRTPFGAQARSYAQGALAWIRPPPPRLYITHGLPGSGKTFASQGLLERCGAVRIRSDVERKRSFGLSPLDDTRSHGIDAYTSQATRATYARMLALARVCLRAGFPVVLDAAFLRRGERAEAAALAQELRVPFSIVACEAPLAVLRDRLRARTADASEADEAVLERLRAGVEPLDAAEQRAVLGPLD